MCGHGVCGAHVKINSPGRQRLATRAARMGNTTGLCACSQYASRVARRSRRDKTLAQFHAVRPSPSRATCQRAVTNTLMTAYLAARNGLLPVGGQRRGPWRRDDRPVVMRWLRPLFVPHHAAAWPGVINLRLLGQIFGTRGKTRSVTRSQTSTRGGQSGQRAGQRVDRIAFGEAYLGRSAK